MTPFRAAPTRSPAVDETWGRAKTGIDVICESVAIPGTNKRLAWLSHAS